MPGDKCGSPDRLGETPRGGAPRQRVLTGDRPTGPLHLGHYVGTLANRVRLQRKHDLFVLVADYHLLTTRLDRRHEVEQAIRDEVLGNLAVGLDPERATIYLQSQVPEVAELFLYLAMLVSVARVRRIPTLKDKLRETGSVQPSYGLLGYPVLQAADILLVKGELVPVGRDQQSHLELTRELTRTFNETFRPVFPVPEAIVPDVGVLPGTDGRSKMSRSLGNSINLFDDAATVTAKVMAMYTDRARIHPTDPGDVEGNPVFAYLDAFNPHLDEVEELKARYRAGRIGDVAVKRRLVEVLNEFLYPIRDRRDTLVRQSPSLVNDVLQAGAARAREEARLTIHEVRAAMNLGYFDG
jgi:tryptophanyl-tRNA synthetase